VVRGVGADVIGIDWRQSLAQAHVRLGDAFALQGNLDPALLLGPPELVAARAAQVLAEAPPLGHVFNLGHGILPETPTSNVAALVECVRELSARRAA
jgi:uroporphyrinogen decarboxylase